MPLGSMSIYVQVYPPNEWMMAVRPLVIIVKAPQQGGARRWARGLSPTKSGCIPYFFIFRMSSLSDRKKVHLVV